MSRRLRRLTKRSLSFAIGVTRRVILLLSILFVRLSGSSSTATLSALRWAWGNRWSASVDYCRAVIAETERHSGNVMEAGSGLTTIILASLGVPVVALEHDLLWARKVRRWTRWTRNATVLHRPLNRFDGYDWYGLQPGDLPTDVRLIVCDGPPGTTRGGRYGLIPIVRPSKGTVVLLDDAARDSERAVLERWREEERVDFEIIPGPKPYARIVV